VCEYTAKYWPWDICCKKDYLFITVMFINRTDNCEVSIHFNTDSKTSEQTMQNFRLLMERYTVTVGLVY
jgi:hypothetical protein